MGNVFVPYADGKPAAISINGHRLIILTTESGILEEGLSLLGGDKVQRYSTFRNAADLKRASAQLAKKCGAGVVIAPAGVDVNDLLRNLESELPWVQ